MATLMIMRGLPASGKSTHAKMLGQYGWKQVERDQLRKEMIIGKWSRRKERDVIQRRNALIREYLTAGFNVVSSDTNLNDRVVATLTAIGKECGAEVEINDSFLRVRVEECIRRDNAREDGVGESVIWRMYWEAFPPKKYVHDPALPYAVITDLDGTLADISHRNPYDASDCENDPVREDVADMIACVKAQRKGTRVIIFSGRNDKYAEQTIRWLVANDIHYSEFYMRPDGDFRPDHVLKREMYDTYIAGKYNVRAVFDDRPQVCRLWRSLGLPLFDVGMGVEF